MLNIFDFRAVNSFIVDIYKESMNPVIGIGDYMSQCASICFNIYWKDKSVNFVCMTCRNGEITIQSDDEYLTADIRNALI